ncbi:DUF1109 domain-containing protein [Tabrizicola sp. J26]|uniref:NrsF family protein n=1 Tax=Alitabrizicola rongguiensis TaxID=2909234 RepID=UPI001F3AD476|nr:DUF1109 domain-containing protein [Tabrizicola rongguiensis]MCF1709718.1 DUF1109 domain-containing protein [Tabrizicola rongguiensis]
MRTDDLIRALAADKVQPASVGSRLALLPLALLVAGGLLLGIIGIRPDLGAALMAPVTALKNLLPLALGLVALILAVRLARPGVSVPVAGLVVFPLVAAALFAYGLTQMQMADWGRGLMGRTAAFCVPAIVLTALLPLVAAMRAMRAGASTDPQRSGALTGLACGALATAIYALHCNEDNPLFFVTWYGLAILIVAGIGAILGRRLLRW